MLIFGLVTHSQSKIIKEEKIENKYINPKDTLELVVSKYVYVTTYEEEYNYPVPFSITDKPPIFPGCLGSEDELKSCFFSKLNKHILDNQVYPEGAKEENISVKIFVYFEIDKSGVVSNIKVRDLNVEFKEEFIKEGKRLIQELPIFEPGIKDGNIIITSLTVPITFKM
jgi:protein TonB